MKIGTTTLPLAGWVVDPRRPETSRALRLAAIRQLVEDYGLQAVELNLDFGVVHPLVFNNEFYALVADLQQELGFTCTVHLPFLWTDASSLNERVRRASVDSLRQAVELVRSVEVYTYVLHLWGLTSMQIHYQLRDPVQRLPILEALLVQSRSSLEQMCDLVDARDLCVENLEDSLFEQVLPLVEECGASLCLDVGHLVSCGQSELAFLSEHADRIREVHLHDAVSPSPDGSVRFRDHLALGQGHIDYLALLRKLEETGYEGVVILENNDRADLEESLMRLRTFL